MRVGNRVLAEMVARLFNERNSGALANGGMTVEGVLDVLAREQEGAVGGHPVEMKVLAIADEVEENGQCQNCGSLLESNSSPCQECASDLHVVTASLSQQGMSVVLEDGHPIELGDLYSDEVNHPPHYNTGKFEVIDVIEDWGLGFHEGNAVKYIARAKHKGSELTDLKKARWYLDRAISNLERTNEQAEDEI